MAKVDKCRHGACFRYALPGSVYCASHQHEQKAWDAEKAAKKAANDAGRWERGKGAEYRWVYRDARWRRARAEQIKRQPLCACGQPATDVDHILPHRGREEYAFNLDNLQSMCHACHMRKTREDRGRA